MALFWLWTLLVFTLFSAVVFPENQPHCEVCLQSCQLPCPCHAWKEFCFPSSSDNVVRSDHSISSQMKIIVVVLASTAILFLCGCIYLLYYLYRATDADATSTTTSQPESIEEGDHYIWNIHTEGLEQSTIDSIAVFEYRNGEGFDEGTEQCSVCLCEFEEGSQLRLLPNCNHAFHIHCIDTWLQSHTICPLCRAPVSTDNNEASSSEVA